MNLLSSDFWNNYVGRASVHKDGNRYPIDPVKLAIIHRMHQYRMAQIHAQHMALIHQNEISQRNEYDNYEDYGSTSEDAATKIDDTQSWGPLDYLYDGK